MNVQIFITNTNSNHDSYIELIDLSELHPFPLEKFFIGYSDFDWSNVIRFDFFDHFNNIDNLKLVLNVCYIPLINKIYVNEQVVQKINSTKNAYLWMITPQESIINEKELLEEIESNSIRNDKVIVSTSNLEYSNKVINGVKFLGFQDWFEGYYTHQLKHFSDVSYIHPESKKITLDKATKKFLCLNRNVREHRFWTYYTLLESPAFNEGHISYHLPKIKDITKDEFDRILNLSLKSLNTKCNKKIIKNLYKSKELDPIDQNSVINHSKDIQPFYYDSLFSIVSESTIHQEFITEKTFKPMAHGHPFIIIGNAKNFERLKTLGYKTFEDIFESKIIETPQQLSKFLLHVHKIPLEEWKDRISSVWDRVKYNYYTLLENKRSFEKFKTELIKLTEQDRNN